MNAGYYPCIMGIVSIFFFTGKIAGTEKRAGILMSLEQAKKQTPRHPKAVLSSLTTNSLHLRNPYMTAWLSATFPGFGHISLGNYVTGIILFLWEMLTNTEAKVNLAILYSFTGRYDMAKEIVDNRWLLIYAPVYVFAVWDSYRRTVKYNQFALLADRGEQVPKPIAMSAYEINALDKRAPWVAVAWTLLAPGLGHLYAHRLVTGFFLLVWWIATVYKSFVLQAMQFTALGLFEQAKAIVDPLWIIYLPSIMGFACYDAYVNTLSFNRLFEKEQSLFFKQKYQNPSFKMPIKVESEVYITASFEHSLKLELAIAELEQKGISQEQICAIPMNVPEKEMQLFDTIHRADGMSMFDLPTVIGTTFMLFGVMWGFLWTWGPIIWGMIGLFLGAALGFAFKYIYYRMSAQKQPPTGKTTEVVLIVGCHKSEAEMVERVLAGHLALSLGRAE